MFLTKKSKVSMSENVEYVLRDKYGNVKPLFKYNKLMTWLRKKGIVTRDILNWFTGSYRKR